MHAVIQVPPDGEVGSRNCRYHPFTAACTLDVAVCFSRQTVSALIPGSRAILHIRHPADCILPILVRKLAVGVFPASAIPNCLLRFKNALEFFGHSNPSPA